MTRPCSNRGAGYLVAMNRATFRDANKAFTLIELLVVIAIIAILAAMLTPAITDRERPSKPVKCMSNLRQVSLGFLLYLSDYGDHFSWQISTNRGGTEELIPNGVATEHFLKLTNYLRQPAVFLCPTEKSRFAADGFTNFSNTNLSYFIPLDARTNSPFAILTGDRHLSVGNQPVKPGLFFVTDSAAPGWTRELHDFKNSSVRGNLAFADGHVEIIKVENLPGVFQRQALATNRLVIP